MVVFRVGNVRFPFRVDNDGQVSSVHCEARVDCTEFCGCVISSSANFAVDEL